MIVFFISARALLYIHSIDRRNMYKLNDLHYSYAKKLSCATLKEHLTASYILHPM